jgi:hypothetical protein
VARLIREAVMYRRQNQPAVTALRKRTRERARLLQTRGGWFAVQAALREQPTAVETTDFRSTIFGRRTMDGPDGNSGTDAKVSGLYRGLRCTRNRSRTLDGDCRRNSTPVTNAECGFTNISDFAICRPAARRADTLGCAPCDSAEFTSWSES